MERYKANPSNANKEKSIRSYKNFLLCLEEVGAELVSDYLSSDDPVEIFCHGVTLNSRAIDFQRKTGKNIKDFFEKCSREGYEFLRFIEKVNTSLIAEIVSPQGQTFKITIGGFDKFLKSDREIKKECEELGIKLVSDYIGIEDNLTYNLYGIEVTSKARDFRSSIIPTIRRLKERAGKEGDTILEFVDKTGGGFTMSIKTYDGAIFDIAHNRYADFIKSRKKFVEFAKKHGIKPTSPYLSTDKPMSFDYYGADIEVIPNVLRLMVSNTNKTKKLCNSAGDVFVKYKKFNATSLSMEILLEGKELIEINTNIYKSFTEGRERFYKKMQEDKVEVLSLYKGNKEKILLNFGCEHKPHWLTPNDYQNGRGCPLCTVSKGEAIIMKYLDSIQEKYIWQYNIKNYNERMSRTRYDIYIPRLKLVVEVNGIQHYEVDGYFNETQEDLDNNILNDINKYYHALENVYEHMEVDYREGKPELALKRFKKQFKEFKKIKGI